jgi:DNA-directed RNA polymerase subunit RPC12/RpoP
MRHARIVFFLVALLVVSTLPLSSATEGRATVCDTTDLQSIPDPINIQDQNCEKIALGILTPGSIVEFDISTTANFDFLVFRNAALQVYANNQSYRSSTFWAEDTVFEDMTGSGRWHWTVPADESAQNWYVVLDNLDHPGDDGQGAQGGSSLQITLSVSFPSQNYWDLHDGLVNLGVNSHTKLIDENTLILDEGTQVSISAIPLSGDPDLFILTENQRLTYLDGNAPEFRVTGADLLQVTTTGSVTWTVDSAHANQPLYLYADNEAGPTGGGDGSTEASFTVIITLLPVMDATITSDATGNLDVGESVTVSSNNTPNLSNQVDTANYEWDLDGDGNYELTGTHTDISWPTEGTFTVNMRANGVDGRTDTTSTSFSVADQTNPIAKINGGNNLVRGFEESFTLTSSSSDNFGIDREEWVADDVSVRTDSGTGNSFTYSFASAGVHTVTLRVFDLANRSTSQTINVTIQDRTAPELSTITGPTDIVAGEEHSWRLNATDLNSPTLTWSWDFDRTVDMDEDGDNKNDAEATGDLVTWTFSKGGNYYITCTVTNEEGLTSTRELSVYVEDKPVEKSAVMTYVYGGGAVLLALAVIGGGLFLFRSISQKRTHQQLMDEEAARLAAEEADSAREPDHQEQLAMYQNRGGSSSGFQRSGGDEMAEIAGVGTSYGTQSPQVSQTSSVDGNALLSAFEESEPQPAPEPEKEIEETPPSTPAVAESGSALSGGIELPGEMIQTASAPESSSIQIPEQEKSIEPEVQTEEPQTTEVVGTCAECGQKYAVDMPNDIHEAQIDCPKCGNRSTIRR